MITEEEWEKLKVGDVVYTVDDTVTCKRYVMSGCSLKKLMHIESLEK